MSFTVGLLKRWTWTLSEWYDYITNNHPKPPSVVTNHGPAHSCLHQVEDIDRETCQTLTLNAPIVTALESKYGGGYVKRVISWDGLLENVGVESIRTISEYANQTDSHHATDMVYARNIRHCWFRQLSASHFAENAVSLSRWTYHVSVIDVDFLDPVADFESSTRFGVAYNVRGQCHLFMNCVACGATRFIVTIRETRGPMAFVNCTSYEGTGATVRLNYDTFMQ